MAEDTPAPVTDREVLDLLGRALAAISIGAASGGAVVCLVLAAAHGMERGVNEPFTSIALAGVMGGLVVAGLTAWTLARPLGPWRGLLATLSALAGAMLVTALTLPADMAGGRIGLLVLGGLCIGVIALARRIFFPAQKAPA